MKKWQLLTIGFYGLILVLVVSTVAYLYVIDQCNNEPQVVTTSKTQEEKDLEAAKTELEKADDFDFSELDTVLTELDQIDLSGV